MADIELTTVPTEGTIDFSNDYLWINDVSETPDAINRITPLALSGQTLVDLRALADPGVDKFLFWDDSAGQLTYLTLPPNVVVSGTSLRVMEVIGFAISDETSDLTAGLGKLTFRIRGGQFTVTAVYAEVAVAPTGSTIIVDINESNTSILGTKLSIDISEKDSTTAGSQATISDAVLADNAEITIDLDQVGSTIAGAGLKVWLHGYRS